MKMGNFCNPTKGLKTSHNTQLLNKNGQMLGILFDQKEVQWSLTFAEF